MKKIASLLAPLAIAALAVPVGAVSGGSVPVVHRSAVRGARSLAAAAPQVASAASGVGLNLDVAGRLSGGGTLFRTAIDIANNTNTNTQVDAYFSGATLTGSPIDVIVSVAATGLADQGTVQLAGPSVFHSDDFIDDLKQLGLISQSEEDAGVLGSLFVIFDSPSAGLFDQIGQGTVQGRFFSANDQGTIGVSASGHELTTTEPTSLVGIVRNTVGEADTPQLYTNMYINNEGYALDNGQIQADDVQVRLTGYSNSTGNVTGQAGPYPIKAFNTIGVPKVWDLVHGSSTDDTLVVFVDIVSGNSAISGLTSTNDNGTKDPSGAQLRPADWPSGQPQ